MSSLVTVRIHSSQFPEAVRRDLLASLRDRRINHKFHYDSIKQSQQWLALHQAYSPIRTDPGCMAAYDQAFAEAARRLPAGGIEVVSLGCGGGQKDLRLLEAMAALGKPFLYTPTDVSLSLALSAYQAAVQKFPGTVSVPLVFDLATVDDLPEALASGVEPASPRLILCLGLLPNFEPNQLLPRVAALLAPGDFLLISANLAPGTDYPLGVERVLPLYDNSMTRTWLMSVLLDLGFERGDGQVRFAIEEDPDGTRRITAWFQIKRVRSLCIYGEAFEFRPGERIQLFFSYRHTRERLRILLQKHALAVCGEWVAPSEEEAVILANVEASRVGSASPSIFP